MNMKIREWIRDLRYKLEISALLVFIEILLLVASILDYLKLRRACKEARGDCSICEAREYCRLRRMDK